MLMPITIVITTFTTQHKNTLNGTPHPNEKIDSPAIMQESKPKT
jgi:hypothetical protein